tara:strand:- start:190 stop:1092 length:903 start_codon:yes stop_codon:yes gene_type:complete
MNLKVSVIMNCYNGNTFLREAISSILSQTYKNWELIFWDNQSTDDSKNIFKSYRDKRLKYFYSKKHTNLYDARNLAIAKSRGEILTFLDVDDIWLKNKLALQVSLFKDKNVNLVYGNYLIKNQFTFYQKNKLGRQTKLPNGFITNELLKDYCIGLLTIGIRKNAIKKYKKIFNPNYNLISDFDFVLNFSLKNKIKSTQSPVGIYRIHSKQQQKILFFKQAEDFCRWFSKIKKNIHFNTLSNFSILKERAVFFKYIEDIRKKNFFENLFKILKIKNFKTKTKLLIILFFRNLAIKYFIKVY